MIKFIKLIIRISLLYPIKITIKTKQKKTLIEFNNDDK